MNATLDALATELYVTVDDILLANPQLTPPRPTVGITPRLSDAELVTLSVLQALLGYHDEARFIRYAHSHLRALFPYLPGRPAYTSDCAALTPRSGTQLRWARRGDATVGHPLCRVVRRPVAGRLHARRVRPLPRDRETVEPGRPRRLRLPRESFPLVLGIPVASRRHTRRPAHHLRADQPEKTTNVSSPGTCSRPTPACSPTATARS